MYSIIAMLFGRKFKFLGKWQQETKKEEEEERKKQNGRKKERKKMVKKRKNWMKKNNVGNLATVLFHYFGQIS